MNKKEFYKIINKYEIPKTYFDLKNNKNSLYKAVCKRLDNINIFNDKRILRHISYIYYETLNNLNEGKTINKNRFKIIKKKYIYHIDKIRYLINFNLYIWVNNDINIIYCRKKINEICYNNDIRYLFEEFEYFNEPINNIYDIIINNYDEYKKNNLYINNDYFNERIKKSENEYVSDDIINFNENDFFNILLNFLNNNINIYNNFEKPLRKNNEKKLIKEQYVLRNKILNILNNVYVLK